MPYWSEINSIQKSLYGRATLILSVISPLRHFMQVPDSFLYQIKFAAGGSILIIAANLIYQIYLPSVQRSYSKFFDYENKCLDLNDRNALSLYEEYGSIVGKSIDLKEFEHSGLDFKFLDDFRSMPMLDEYKENFIVGHEDGGSGEVIKPQLVRSLAALKYVTYDVSKPGVRKLCLALMLVGALCMYLPSLYGTLEFIFFGG